MPSAIPNIAISCRNLATCKCVTCQCVICKGVGEVTYSSSSSSSSEGYSKLLDWLVSTDLPRESARWAWIAALRFQVALRLFRLDLEVFFFGTAMNLRISR